MTHEKIIELYRNSCELKAKEDALFRLENLRGKLEKVQILDDDASVVTSFSINDTDIANLLKELLRQRIEFLRNKLENA